MKRTNLAEQLIGRPDRRTPEVPAAISPHRNFDRRHADSRAAVDVLIDCRHEANELLPNLRRLVAHDAFVPLRPEIEPVSLEIRYRKNHAGDGGPPGFL